MSESVVMVLANAALQMVMVIFHVFSLEFLVTEVIMVPLLEIVNTPWIKLLALQLLSLLVTDHLMMGTVFLMKETFLVMKNVCKFWVNGIVILVNEIVILENGNAFLVNKTVLYIFWENVNAFWGNEIFF